MSGTDQDVERAREQAVRARLQLAETMGEIQDRLHPATLVNDFLEELRGRGHDMAEQAAEFARARPAVTSTIAAGLIAFLAREPIWRALAILIARWRERPEAAQASKKEKKEKKEKSVTPAGGKVPDRYEEVA